jgi:hypothetical protein
MKKDKEVVGFLHFCIPTAERPLLLKKTYVYKMYLCVYPTELAHSKEITISFEPKPVTVAVIWKENLFQFYIIWCFKGNLCLGITSGTRRVNLVNNL